MEILCKLLAACGGEFHKVIGTSHKDIYRGGDRAVWFQKGEMLGRYRQERLGWEETGNGKLER
jgi:hypothetical protein